MASNIDDGPAGIYRPELSMRSPHWGWKRIVSITTVSTAPGGALLCSWLG